MSQSYNRKGFYPFSESAKLVIECQIAASQSIKKGDALALNSGLVDLAVAGDARIFGFAAEDATSNASKVRTDEVGAKRGGTTILVHVAKEGDVFLGRADADSSSLVAGSEVDLVGTTGIMQLDADASSTDVFMLIAPHPDDTTSSAGARWFFTVNKPVIGAID